LFYSNPLLKVNRKGVLVKEARVEVDYTDNLTFFERSCLIVAAKGYCSSNPEEVAKVSVDWVLKIKQHIKFLNDHSLEDRILNEKQ